jgi:polar amino acid transport system substrate-binding protein
MRRSFAALLGLAGCLLGWTDLQAAEVQAPQRLVSAGRLTYATNTAFPPFEFMRNDQLTGFDIDMAKLLSAKLGLEATPLIMSFDGMLPALQGGRVDIVNSGMYINDKRKEQAFLVPYLRIGQELLVRKGNPAGITGRDALCGKRVAVATGSIMETYAHRDSERCTAAGKPAITVLNFPDGNSVVALRQGRADAYYGATPAAAALVNSFPNDFEIAGETFEANTLLGIAVAKDRPDLREAIEKALAAIRADGSLAQVATQYGIPVSSLTGF